MKQGIFKLFKFSGIFISVSIVCYIFLVIIFGEFLPNFLRNNLRYEKADPGFVDLRFQETTNFRNVDLLFIGSSRSYRHYDTRFFQKKGIKSFNLGTGGMTFLQAEILLKMHVDSLNPKLIIFDVFPFMLTSDGIESSLKLINHSKPSEYFLKMLWQQKNIKVLNSIIYSNYRSLNYGIENIEYNNRGDHMYVSGGFVESKVRDSKSISKDTLEFKIRDFQLQSFNNILLLLKRKNISVIFVQSPMHKGISYKNENDFNSLFIRNNLKYFNFNELSFLNDTIHFYDSMHLNQDGVELYNDYFFEKVLDQE